jgi:uncharacterized protein
MTCNTCGAPLSDDAQFCPTCGAAVAAPGELAGGPGVWPGPPPGPPPGSAHPSGLPSEVRNWGVAAHLSAFLGAFVALAVLGPLVVWLLRREVDGFSERHAREALNFNLTLLMLLAAGVVLAVLTLGIGLIVILPVGAFVVVAWIVLTIVAAVRAPEGREYRYPFTIRFVS